MAANPGAQLPRQPNWDNVVGHMDGLHTELSCCPNIPALNDGARILQAITDMRDDMNRRLTDMCNDMDGRFDRLEQKQATLDKNNQARIANAATPKVRTTYSPQSPSQAIF